ncbi:MAG: FAD-binding oxidoreductase [Candidatus Limnocylindrales bacterium]
MAVEPNATLVDREDLTPTIARLRVRHDDGAPAFRAGQYFAVGLPVDGRWIQRPYSSASAPAETGALEFLVRLVPEGALTPHLWRLRPGHRVRIGPPKGRFTLDPGDRRRHVFLATGTGIAPLLSMLESLLRDEPPVADNGRNGPPIVIHGVATVAELAYRRRLEGLARAGAIVYVPTISRPADPANDGWHGRTGRLDSIVASISAGAGLETAATVAYLCGNPAMIAAVEPRLAALGIPADAIRAEQYWAPPAAGSPPTG